MNLRTNLKSRADIPLYGWWFLPPIDISRARKALKPIAILETLHLNSHVLIMSNRNTTAGGLPQTRTLSPVL